MSLGLPYRREALQPAAYRGAIFTIEARVAGNFSKRKPGIYPAFLFTQQLIFLAFMSRDQALVEVAAA